MVKKISKNVLTPPIGKSPKVLPTKEKFRGNEYEGVLRTTFIIDEEGVIERVIDKVNTKDHADQILD